MSKEKEWFFFGGNLEKDKQEKVFSEIISVIEKEYINGFIKRIKPIVNNSEEISNDSAKLGENERDKVNYALGININRVAGFLEENSNNLLDKLKRNKDNVNLNISPANSLNDIFLNMAVNGGNGLDWLMKKDNYFLEALSKNEKSNPAINNLKIIFEYLPYYVEELLKFEEKLKDELEKMDGYVERYSIYIKDIKNIKKPFLRLLLFYLFSKLEKEHSSNLDFLDDFLKKTEKLTTGGIEQYLEVDKIKEDIEKGIFVKYRD